MPVRRLRIRKRKKGKPRVREAEELKLLVPQLAQPDKTMVIVQVL